MSESAAFLSERLELRAPRELVEAIQHAATQEMTSQSEYVRRVLIERLRSAGVLRQGIADDEK